MRKIAVLLALLLAFGCAPKYEKSPTQVVEQFHDSIFRFEFADAYRLLDSRLKTKTSPESFRTMFDSKEQGKELKTLRERIRFEYTDEKITGKKAVVHGKAFIDGKDNGTFRMRLVLESNEWKIDSEVIENEDYSNRGYFRDPDLMTDSQTYFLAMMNGDVKTMWAMTTNRVKTSTTIEQFTEETISTTTGTTPEKEGFTFEIKQSFANDDGLGYTLVKISQPKSKDAELAEGVGFKVPFVHTDEGWKADFSRITDDFKVQITD